MKFRFKLLRKRNEGVWYFRGENGEYSFRNSFRFYGSRWALPFKI